MISPDLGELDEDGAGLARPHNVDGMVNGYGQKTLVKWNKRVRELSRRFYWGVAIKHFAARRSQNVEGVASGRRLAGERKAPAPQDSRHVWREKLGGLRKALRRPGLSDLSPGVSPDSLGPYYGAAANDLNRIFRVDDAGWRHAPQFNA